jgi:hypothetical protein
MSVYCAARSAAFTSKPRLKFPRFVRDDYFFYDFGLMQRAIIILMTSAAKWQPASRDIYVNNNYVTIVTSQLHHKYRVMTTKGQHDTPPFRPSVICYNAFNDENLIITGSPIIAIPS